MARQHQPTPEERDERVSLPLPPEVAIEAILAVDPDDDSDADTGPANRLLTPKTRSARPKPG